MTCYPQNLFEVHAKKILTFLGMEVDAHTLILQCYLLEICIGNIWNGSNIQDCN